MGGRPCIRGFRVTVSLIVNLVANGMTVDAILREYPELERRTFRKRCGMRRLALSGRCLMALASKPQRPYIVRQGDDHDSRYDRLSHAPR